MQHISIIGGMLYSLSDHVIVTIYGFIHHCYKGYDPIKSYPNCYHINPHLNNTVEYLVLKVTNEKIVILIIV